MRPSRSARGRPVAALLAAVLAFPSATLAQEVAPEDPAETAETDVPPPSPEAEAVATPDVPPPSPEAVPAPPPPESAPGAAEPPPPTYPGVDEVEPVAVSYEGDAAQGADAGACSTPGRRRCTHFDLGLHGYLVSDTTLLGLQGAVGHEWFSVRGQAGVVINDGLEQQFDTDFLGYYFGGTLSAYFLRSERLEARAGLGVLAFWLDEVSTELTYYAATLSAAGAWVFLPPMLSVFVELSVLPWHSEGLDTGYAPVMLQLGVEVTL